ncbi:hypothetical protein Tco_0695143 [Tanacetum coccineum]
MLNYPRFTKVIIHYFLTKDKIVSKRNKICMHTFRDDYLINTLIFVFTNEESQIYGAQLSESMTSPKKRESKAYKTYLGYSTGVTPPKKTRKFKEPASSKLTTIPASPKEPTKKDTHNVSVSKKNTPAKADRGNCIELLSDASLLEEAQIKKTLKKSKQETHKLQASGSSRGADFKSEVPGESTTKSSDTNEGTCVKPGVPDVSNADSFESDNELWGDSDDDNESDDNNNEGSENDDDSGNDTYDSERTDSNEEENPNLNLNVDKEEETQEEEYVYNTDYSVPTDEETDDENMEFDDEEYDDLYKDVNVRSKVSEHEEVGKGDVEMTDATRESGSKQSSSMSSDFASKFLILDNVPPVVDEVASMMNVKVRQEE